MTVDTSAAPAYLRPANLADALAALTAPATVLAGGTDLYAAHVDRPLPARLVDLTAIAGLRGITSDAGGVRFGAATTWSDIAAADLPPAFDALRQAARQIGSVQVQNRATLAGNLCNASPAADGVPPLLALDAMVDLAAATGTRRLPLADFITGYRRTALAPGEIVTAIVVPATAGRSVFEKLGARRYLVISIVSVAALIVRDATGRVARAGVAVGSASAVARRLPAFEQALAGLAAGVAPSTLLRDEHLDGLAPIDDVRASAFSRVDAARRLVADAVDRAGGA